MKALSVAAALLWSGSLAAQATGIVYGTVRDSLGRPIHSAIVQTSGGHSTTADKGGHYRIISVPAGRVEVRAGFIGYRSAIESLTVIPNDSTRADFALHLSLVYVIDEPFITMPPVVVTAAKRAQSLENVVASVALLSDSDISRRAVSTVDEAVDRAPSVQFLNGQVNIRGSTGYVQGLGSRVLLLVDGVPMNQGDRGGIDWDMLQLDDVERVEVVKGAGSSLYGSAAFGGVVNVITRKIPDGWHGRVRATGGGFANPPIDIWRFRDCTGALWGTVITESYATENLGGSVTIGGRHSDGYRQQDRQDHWDIAGKGRWRPDPLTDVTVSGTWASNQYQSPLQWCVRGTCDDRGQSYQPFLVDTSGLGDHTRSDKGYLTATVVRTPSSQLRWLARASLLRNHFTDFRRVGDDFGIANRWGGEVRGEYRPDGHRVVTVGAEAALSDVTSDIFGSHTQDEYAAYGESEEQYGRARVTVGARVDFLTIDGGGLSAQVSPRIGAVLPTRSGIWRASVGKAFRAPSLAERFPQTSVSGIPVVPNPTLQAERAWTGELGDLVAFGARGRFDAAVFWTEASDLIEPRVDTLIQFQNLQRARLAGLDLAVSASPLTDHLTTTLAYTFLYARELAHDTLPRQPLAFRPRHLITTSIDYSLGALSAGAEFRYSSRFERVELYEAEPRVSAKVLDLRASWRYGPLSVRFRAANVLNYIYALVPRTLAPVRTLTLTALYAY